MIKGKINSLFGKKKNNNDTNTPTTPTDSEPPKLSLDTLVFADSKLDISPDSLTTSPVNKVSPSAEVASSAANNPGNRTGLLGEIFSELNTGNFFF
jgi:hypothetical protein